MITTPQHVSWNAVEHKIQKEIETTNTFVAW